MSKYYLVDRVDTVAMTKHELLRHLASELGYLISVDQQSNKHENEPRSEVQRKQEKFLAARQKLRDVLDSNSNTEYSHKYTRALEMFLDTLLDARDSLKIMEKT